VHCGEGVETHAPSSTVELATVSDCMGTAHAPRRSRSFHGVIPPVRDPPNPSPRRAINHHARPTAGKRRPTVTDGTADPDAAFRDPACPPNAAIRGIVALNIAYCPRIRARRAGRVHAATRVMPANDCNAFKHFCSMVSPSFTRGATRAPIYDALARRANAA
jgi:hypothetical protein